MLYRGQMILLFRSPKTHSKISEFLRKAIHLPVESQSAQQIPDKDKKFHALSIDAAGRYYLDDRTAPLSIAELKTRLRLYSLEKNKPVIRLRMDAKATAQQLITVMDELKKLDLTSITFDTQTGG